MICSGNELAVAVSVMAPLAYLGAAARAAGLQRRDFLVGEVVAGNHAPHRAFENQPVADRTVDAEFAAVLVLCADLDRAAFAWRAHQFDGGGRGRADRAGLRIVHRKRF